MLNKVILNFIIVVSILGIGALSAKEYLSKKTLSQSATASFPTTSVVAPTPTSIPDPLTSCNHTYMALTKGTTWRYSLTSEHIKPSTKSAQLARVKPRIDTFTNTVVNVATGSATIETVFSSKKKTKTTRLTCRNSGIYGIPFPLFDLEEITKSQQSSLLSAFVKLKPIQFLPNQSVLLNGNKWLTTISPQLSIPFLQNSFSFTVENTITNNGNSNNELQVDSKIDTSSLPIPIFETQSTIYTLSPKKGPTDLSIKIESSMIGNINIQLKLLGFKEGDIN